MSIININKVKKHKVVLTSVAFLMLSTVSIQAHAIVDEEKIKGISHTLSQQLEVNDEKPQQYTQQYNLVGVALFSGRDPVSYGIQGLTHSKTSHVGIILSDANDENNWYCFESTGSASEVLRGEYPHARITPWSEVKEYDGKVNYRLFVFEDQERPKSDLVTNFVDEYDNKSYPKNPFKLIKALFNNNKKSKSNILKTVFCSELTAQMFMDLNILEKGVSGNYLPKHFTAQKNILLKPGVSLTPEF